MFKKLFQSILPSNPQVRDANIYREIIRDGAKMGGTLFGPVDKGSRREFFCLDEHTWVWHEEWTDGSNIRHSRTTRYDIRPHGVFKAQDGYPYQPLSAEEVQRLYAAAERYQQQLHVKFDPLLATAS